MAQVRIAQGVSLPDSWQRKVLLASQYVLSGSEEDSFSAEESDDWFFYNVDNTSNRCANWLDYASADCSYCETRVLFRWTRILFYKVARTYMAAPLLLMLLPLCIGLMVGMCIGRRYGQRHEKKQAPNTKLHNDSNGIFAWSLWILSFLSKYYPFQKLAEKENQVRTELKSDANMARESGIDLENVPRHVAVIMDGNRRYGRARYGNVSKGHWDGSKTLVDFAKWCIAEKVQVLTVYAFSTENWNRDPSEVASLMTIFCKYCDELRVEAIERNIRIRVLSTETERIPGHVKAGLHRMVDETKHCENGLTMNICLSYGSRGEIVNVCKALAMDAREGTLQAEDITERHIEEKLLTSHCADPDVVIRTSGEYRLSNFLLWQLAYTEMFFVPKQWPELDKSDLLHVIRTYANGRRRRFGK